MVETRRLTSVDELIDELAVERQAQRTWRRHRFDSKAATHDRGLETCRPLEIFQAEEISATFVIGPLS